MTRQPFRYLFVFTFLLTQTHFLVQVTRAQAAQAELTGEVRDQTGATLTSVRVSLTAVYTGRVISTTSGESGIYLFTNLPPGSYTITAEAQGFKKSVRDGGRLSTGESV